MDGPQIYHKHAMSSEIFIGYQKLPKQQNKKSHDDYV